MGRSVANEGFIRALLRRDAFAAYHFFLSSEEQRQILSGILASEYPEMWANNRFWVTTIHELPQALRQHRYHCFHLSDCVVHPAHLARLRNALSARVFPITSVTHSLSYARYGSALFQQLWQGTTGRDAVIVTSQAGKSVLERLFDQLRQGYGLCADSFAQPQLKHIPLGIEPSVFSQKDGALREQARSKLSAETDDIVLLVMARLSHHSKMDLIPLLRAVQRMRTLDDTQPGVHTRLVLTIAGYVQEGDRTPEVLRAFAESIGLRLVIVPTPSDAERNGLYAAADIFVSPSDNVQETFGLTLLEAGAAKLPVIASDFDGYRDLVVHGETGLCIPTLGPAHTRLLDMMGPLVFDTTTHLELAQQTVVDVPGLAHALFTLAKEPAARQKMGLKAHERVCASYSWDTVVEQYLALWDELNNRDVISCSDVAGDALGSRLDSGDDGEFGQHADNSLDRPLCRHTHPQHMVYGTVFGMYPTRVLSDSEAASLEVVWSAAGRAVYREQDFPIVYEGIAHKIDMPTVRTILFMARKPVTVQELLKKLAAGGTLQRTSGLEEGTGNDHRDDGMDGAAANSSTHEFHERAEYHRLLAVEELTFMILWSLKQDLLECTSTQQRAH